MSDQNGAGISCQAGNNWLTYRLGKKLETKTDKLDDVFFGTSKRQSGIVFAVLFVWVWFECLEKAKEKQSAKSR